MSYNRWMPPECRTELYHHGVKGMKWGKHLFGKGVEVQAGAGGGGGGNEEDLKLLEELKKKYGDKALEMFKKIKQQQQSEDGRYGTLDKLREKITGNADPDNIKQVHDRVYERTLKGAKATNYSGAKSETDEEYASRSAKETAEKTKEYIKDHSVAGAVNKVKKKLNLGGSIKAEHHVTVSKTAKGDAGNKGKSFYEQNKDKMHYKVGDMDTDARVRRYTAEGRERFRQNGMYRNMNLKDVYGPNAKIKNHAGRDGVDLFKKIDVSDNRNGMNYATREQDKSKYNDGKYGFKDRVREKITGKMDPDYKKDAYNKKVSAAVRTANQKQAWSVGMEEADIRNKAKDYVDRLEKQVYDKSLAGAIERRRKKKRR